MNKKIIVKEKLKIKKLPYTFCSFSKEQLLARMLRMLVSSLKEIRNVVLRIKSVCI